MKKTPKSRRTRAEQPAPVDAKALAEEIVIMQALFRPSGKERIPLQCQAECGIREQPFYAPDGSLVLVAINVVGREVGRVAVSRLSDYDSAHRSLEAMLLQADPAGARSLQNGEPLVS